MSAGAFAHQRDLLLHQGRKRAEPGDPIFVVFDRFKTETVSEFVQSLRAATLIDRHQVGAEFGSLDIRFEVFPEQVVVELIRWRKLRAIDFGQPGQRIGRMFLVVSNRLQASICPTIVPPPVAQRGSPGWILFHLVIPFRFKEVVQRFSRIEVTIFALSVGGVRQSQQSEDEKRD